LINKGCAGHGGRADRLAPVREERDLVGKHLMVFGVLEATLYVALLRT
jgi:hypothetical protein